MLRGHAVAYRHTGVLPARLLLLLQVLVVGHLLLLFVGHVARVNPCGTRHVRLLSADIAVSDVLGRLGGHLRGIDAVLVGGRIGSVEASLEIDDKSVEIRFEQLSFARLGSLAVARTGERSL